MLKKINILDFRKFIFGFNLYKRSNVCVLSGEMRSYVCIRDNLLRDNYDIVSVPKNFQYFHSVNNDGQYRYISIRVDGNVGCSDVNGYCTLNT